MPSTIENSENIDFNLKTLDQVDRDSIVPQPQIVIRTSADDPLRQLGS